MKCNGIRSARGAWLGGALALCASACGTPSGPKAAGDTVEEGAGVKENSAPMPASQRLVCPQCINWAGGETSDFGDVSTLLPGGEGLTAARTPCEQGEQASSIDEAAARALGYGASIDRLATSFDLPYEWSSPDPTDGLPATGYASSTRVRGSTRVVGLEHVIPMLAGCEDSLRVQVATTLEMADGALSIGGQLAATVTRDSEVPVVSGALDLSTARGTLEIHLPSPEESFVGYVYTALYLWPDGVRESVDVWALDPTDMGSDRPSYFYLPLSGRAPVDACNVAARPVAVDEPLSWLGESLADRYPEVRARLAPTEPSEARWSSGAATSVRTELGEPFDACDHHQVRVTYRVPLGINSADGRVSIQQEARANLWFEPGDSARGWVSISSDVVEGAEGFAEATGISGVDFGALRGARWYTGLYLDGPEVEPRVRGVVMIEGIATDETVTGELESLRW